MKAVVKTKPGHGHVEYMDIPEPLPGPGTVEVRVKAAGICGTDLHIYSDEFPSVPPVVLGHEFSGEVVAVGPGVSQVKAGDRVMSELPVAPCGQCRYCKTGYLNLCTDRRGLGWSADGSFAEYMIAEERCLHLVPEGIDFEEAALCEPLAVASYGVIELTGVRAGDIVYISGPGPIGLMAAQAAMAEGATVVVGGVASDSSRLAVARELDVHRAVNVEEEDLSSILFDMTDGLGADVVFECSGAEVAAAQCLEMVRKGGRYTQMGLFGRPVQVDLDRLVLKEVRAQGVFSSNWRAWDRALRLVRQDRVRLNPLITHRFPLSEWERAFELLWQRKGLKILLLPEN
ncbi:zinc-binding dehydrogenase [Chloroflexota bacterium]